MKLLDMLILILATWRISSLLANENGPAGCIEWLRQKIGVLYVDGERYGKNAAADEILCQWCNSIWIGIILTVVYMFWPKVILGISLPFALSAGTILIMTSKGVQVFLRRMGEK